MKTWKSNEKKDSKNFNTKSQPASGRFDNYPGDSINDSFVIDTKTTSKSSYSISEKVWNKLCEEAVMVNRDKKNRVPAISLHLPNSHLVILSFTDLKNLISAY